MILNLPTFCQLWSLTLDKAMGIQHSVRWKIAYPHSISTPPSLNTSAKFKFRLFMLNGMESNDTKFAHFLSTLVSHAWKSYGYPAFGKVKDCLSPFHFQPHLHWTRQPSLNSDCSCWMESNDTKFAHFLSTLVSHAWKSYGYPAFGKVKDCLSPFHFNPTFTEHISQV